MYFFCNFWIMTGLNFVFVAFLSFLTTHSQTLFILCSFVSLITFVYSFNYYLLLFQFLFYICCIIFFYLYGLYYYSDDFVLIMSYFFRDGLLFVCRISLIIFYFFRDGLLFMCRISFIFAPFVKFIRHIMFIFYTMTVN